MLFPDGTWRAVILMLLSYFHVEVRENSSVAGTLLGDCLMVNMSFSNMRYISSVQSEVFSTLRCTVLSLTSTPSFYIPRTSNSHFSCTLFEAGISVLQRPNAAIDSYQHLPRRDDRFQDCNPCCIALMWYRALDAVRFFAFWLLKHTDTLIQPSYAAHLQLIASRRGVFHLLQYYSQWRVPLVCWIYNKQCVWYVYRTMRLALLSAFSHSFCST